MRNRNSRRALGRKRGLASARAWTPSAADADTLRRRALHDARGQIIREGITYHGNGRVTPWSVRRSVAGRSDQLDVFVGGALWRTGGQRRVARWLSPKSDQNALKLAQTRSNPLTPPHTP